ncbi:MAG TPA: hypothetical protein VG675_11275 [Bryobacteraceae bacterium]|nr:hypothetical protein [Bryobacteraceae bacterium]
MNAILRIALPAAILAAMAVAQDTSTSNLNQVRTRGQTPVADERQSLDRGRIGTQQSMPPEPLNFAGVLVDAGCRDRSDANLAQKPISVEGALPAMTPAAATAEKSERSKQGYASTTGTNQSPAQAVAGITVDQKTLDSERRDILMHQVEELNSRQMDAGCAITGATHGFAVLLDNGRFLNLDQGGNTYAALAVQSSTAGKAMLNGQGPGVKPRVSIVGRIFGDRLMVDTLKLQ